LLLDGSARLNLATFVTTWMEPEAAQLMAESVDKNMIDKDEYPQTAEIERRCVSILADLWNVPDPAEAIGCSTTGTPSGFTLTAELNPVQVEEVRRGTAGLLERRLLRQRRRGEDASDRENRDSSHDRLLTKGGRTGRAALETSVENTPAADSLQLPFPKERDPSGIGWRVA